MHDILCFHSTGVYFILQPSLAHSVTSGFHSNSTKTVCEPMLPNMTLNMAAVMARVEKDVRARSINRQQALVMESELKVRIFKTCFVSTGQQGGDCSAQPV